jgi:hypothetical protein
MMMMKIIVAMKNLLRIHHVKKGKTITNNNPIQQKKQQNYKK